MVVFLLTLRSSYGRELYCRQVDLTSSLSRKQKQLKKQFNLS
ncbi:hypothetical protein [uncultured Dokdonia sp.]|nr:hypothetical protein [uncultured Dokdonia sp.]